MSAVAAGATAALAWGRERPALLAAAAGAALGPGLVLLASFSSPVVALAAVVGAVLFAVLVRWPVLGLFLTAAVVPIERLGRLTDDATMYTVSLMRLVGMVGLAALVLNRLLRKKGFIGGLPLYLYAVFVGFSLLSISYTEDLVKSVQMSGTFVGNLLFFFLIINLARDRRLMDRAIVIWLASSVLTGVYATYDWHLGSGRQGGITTAAVDIDPGRGRRTEDRMSAVWEDRGELESLSGVTARRSMGPTSHAAVFGINLILTLPFFLYALRLVRSRWWTLTIAGGAAIVLYNIFLTNTRSVILTAAFVAVLCVARGLIRITGVQVAAACGAVALVLLLVPADTYNRSLDFANYTPERSATLRIRLAYWEAAVEMIGDHWLTGLGSGNERAMMKYVRLDTPEASNLHNEYLQTMMEVGLFAAAVFFSFLAVLLRQAFGAASVFRRQPQAQDEYWLLVSCQIAMITVLLYGLQVDVFHFPLKGWWLIAGLVFGLYRLSRVPQPAAVAA